MKGQRKQERKRAGQYSKCDVAFNGKYVQCVLFHVSCSLVNALWFISLPIMVNNMAKKPCCSSDMIRLKCFSPQMISGERC